MAWWTNRLEFSLKHQSAQMSMLEENETVLSEDTFDAMSIDSLDQMAALCNKKTYLKQKISNEAVQQGAPSGTSLQGALSRVPPRVPLSKGPVSRSDIISAQEENRARKMAAMNRPIWQPHDKHPDSYRFGLIRKLRPSSPSSSTFCEGPSTRSSISANSSFNSSKSTTSLICAGLNDGKDSAAVSTRSSSRMKIVPHFPPLAPMSASLGPTYVSTEKLKRVLEQQMYANDVRRRLRLRSRRLAAPVAEEKAAAPPPKPIIPQPAKEAKKPRSPEQRRLQMRFPWW